MRAAWIQHGGEHPWASQVADVLREHGVEVRFLCTLRDSVRDYEASGHAAEWVAGPAFAGPVPDTARLEEALGPPGLRAIADTDVHLLLLFPRDPSARLAVVRRSLAAWDAWFDRERPGLVIARDVGSFATAPAYLVARARGVPVLVLNIGPTDRHMSLCDRGPLLQWTRLLENLEKPPGALEPAQRERVRALVEERLRGASEPARIRPMDPLWRLPRDYAWALREGWRARRARDPIRVAQFRLLRQNLRKRAWWRLATRRAFRYDQPEPGQPFAYFPLYFENEWQNLAGPRFHARNMLALVQEAADALPSGHVLYVKEHPAVPGELSLRRLRALRRLPGVRVIHPLVNGRGLVRDADVVVSLLGSTGWEAVLMDRPVVVLFDTWYSRFPGVEWCRDVNRLQDHVWSALRRRDAPYGPEERRLWYIHQVIDSAPEANVYNVEPPFFTAHNLENSRRVALAILDAAGIPRGGA